MLDREVVKKFLEEKLEGIEIPEDISFDVLVETFCKYTEADYYEWLKLILNTCRLISSQNMRKH